MVLTLTSPYTLLRGVRSRVVGHTWGTVGRRPAGHWRHATSGCHARTLLAKVGHHQGPRPADQPDLLDPWITAYPTALATKLARSMITGRGNPQTYPGKSATRSGEIRDSCVDLGHG